MVDPEIVATIRRYLAALPEAGIHPSQAVVFGSNATGRAHEWSDIDLIVIAPEFDFPRPIPLKTAAKLWTVAREIDARIEALPCGVNEWKSARHDRAVLMAAARDGIEVAA